MAEGQAQFTYPRGFTLVTADGAVVAQGYEIFGMYVVSWIGAPPDYRIYPSIDAAIEAHGVDADDYEVRWT